MSSQTQTPAQDQERSESTSAIRRLGGFIKKMILGFVLTLILFALLKPIVGMYSAFLAMFLAGTAVNVYYADPDKEN